MPYKYIIILYIYIYSIIRNYNTVNNNNNTDNNDNNDVYTMCSIYRYMVIAKLIW